MKFLPYNPAQAYLLPPSVKDVLGENHLCFFSHRVVEQLDLSAMEEDYDGGTSTAQGQSWIFPFNAGEEGFHFCFWRCLITCYFRVNLRS